MLLNNGLLFYRHYANQLPSWLELPRTTLPKRCNDLLTEQRYDCSTTPLPLCEQSFQLETRYPGLLIGTGYPHGYSGQKEAIQVGFHFDYATGLPVIPGSSVKGALRNPFAQWPEYVKELLPAATSRDVTDLDAALFENAECVFFDAWPVKPQRPSRLLFGTDYITPHTATTPNKATARHKATAPDEVPPGYEGLIEPIPVPILKVLPQVVYVFRFRLPETIGALKRVEVLGLLRQLILDLGLGARTNLGFGVFAPVEHPVPMPMVLRPSEAETKP